MEKQKENNNNRITITDYPIKINGNFIKVKSSLREARKFIKEEIPRMYYGQSLPENIQLLKRTTTQIVMETYKPKTTQVLEATDLNPEFD